MCENGDTTSTNPTITPELAGLEDEENSGNTLAATLIPILVVCIVFSIVFVFLVFKRKKLNKKKEREVTRNFIALSNVVANPNFVEHV